MTIRTGTRLSIVFLITSALVALTVQPLAAQEVTDEVAELRRLVEEQSRRLDEQQERLERQEQEINRLQIFISAESVLLAEEDTAMQRGTGIQSGSSLLAASQEQVPPEQVGEAPPEEIDGRPAVAAVPPEQGVLTPAGRFVFEPSFQYVNTANNRLVFRGFELIPGIQVGLIEASRARRDTFAETLALRYGVTPRLEIEGRVPLIYRNDVISVTQQRDEGIVREIELDGRGVGDVELSMRYQLNKQNGQKPIWIAGLRVKSDTGIGPFDVGYDEFGVADGLTTGSGFWGVQPSISMLLPSDPVVIFGGLSYLHQFGRNIDRLIGEVPIGYVDPGGSIGASLGFGFSLNPRFSFSLGYRHNYVFPTETEIGNSFEESDSLQVGTLTFGMSYRLNERDTVNFSFEFGATEDAPDLGVTVRFPFVL
jgi:hypothetical protein